MMSGDKSKKQDPPKDEDQSVDKPETRKVPPRGRTFSGRGVEKRG